MASEDNSNLEALKTSMENLNVQQQTSSSSRNDAASGNGVEVTCFTEVVDDVTLHLQIIHLGKQIYAWIGCNSGKLGHLYAAVSTRPNNTASVTCVLGGNSDNSGTGIARRLVLKTGLNIMLASNIPKNSPLLEANAEKKIGGEANTFGVCNAKIQRNILVAKSKGDATMRKEAYLWFLLHKMAM